jgi:hypothetical protein
MDLDMGQSVDIDKIELFYNEEVSRYFIDTYYHDIHIGCDVSLTDTKLKNIPDNSHILGTMQGPDYFYHRIEEIKQWLKVKPEYDKYDFSSDDICILNIRANLDKAVFLPKSSWIKAINHMLDINPNMSFLVITEDPNTIKQFLPELADNTYDFGIGEDYSIIKNAKYLIASNSSFSIFPSLTSETLKYVIAPKYMLRHNISDGYWCQGYNIYPKYTYMDREGNLFSYEECIKEFNEYCIKNNFYDNKVTKKYSPFPDVATIKPKQ